MPGPTPGYIGRFAPSPTGPLHLGSLIAALASYLDARQHRGHWLVRMEDLDPPREEPGAADRILHSLRAHGLDWDGEVMWQGQRAAAYQDALDTLQPQLFHCDCTRAMLGPGGSCDGRCQPRQAHIASPSSIRIPVPPDCRIGFNDRIQGVQDEQLGQQFADFVLRRKDGLDAYQLAVVVDDADQGITHIVRGSDLLDSTARQIYLQRLLGCPTPAYAHLPVITNDEGQKFSKQNHAPALDDDRPTENLRKALRFLHQAEPPTDLVSVADVLAFAVQHWSLAAIPAKMAITASTAL